MGRLEVMTAVDRAITRIKRQPLPPAARTARVQEVLHCGVCPFKTKRITRAYAHSLLHGPWPAELGGSKGYLESIKPVRRVS